MCQPLPYPTLMWHISSKKVNAYGFKDTCDAKLKRVPQIAQHAVAVEILEVRWISRQCLSHLFHYFHTYGPGSPPPPHLLCITSWVEFPYLGVYRGAHNLSGNVINPGCYKGLVGGPSFFLFIFCQFLTNAWTLTNAFAKEDVKSLLDRLFGNWPFD